MTATYKSKAPLFKAALLTALQARTGLSGVTVSYGVPLNAPREMIVLGDLSGEQSWAALGHLRRDETFTLDVYCSVIREGNQQQTCSERCFDLAAEVEDELRTNPTMTNTVRVCELSAPFQLEEFAGDQARQSILTLGVQATERI